MKSQAIAINLDNGFDLVAVWQREERKWQLLQLARPKEAIALYQENPEPRLVFPTGMNPNHREQKMLNNSSKGDSNNLSIGLKRYNASYTK